MKLSSRKVVKKNIFLWCSRLMNPKVKQICQLLFPKSTVNIQWKCRPTTTRSPRSAGKKIKQFEELCLCKSLFKKNIMIIILHECLPKLRIHLGKVNYCFIFRVFRHSGCSVLPVAVKITTKQQHQTLCSQTKRSREKQKPRHKRVSGMFFVHVLPYSLSFSFFLEKVISQVHRPVSPSVHFSPVTVISIINITAIVHIV